jgi:hypothetical protein
VEAEGYFRFANGNNAYRRPRKSGEVEAGLGLQLEKMSEEVDLQTAEEVWGSGRMPNPLLHNDYAVDFPTDGRGSLGKWKLLPLS